MTEKELHRNIPRIMLAAVSSGSGKTLITCGILQALVNRGLNVASFKCGPDYIDPMFHSRVIGTRSRNVDTFFTDDDVTRYLFARTAELSDISVIEGVMGYYDGLGGKKMDGSSYDVSCRLSTPVILIVNCKGAALSAVPVVKGFKEFHGEMIRGVILNNMPESIYNDVKEMIEDEVDVEVLGYVPNVKELVLESRHLGLVLPNEIVSLKEKLNSLADVLENTLDIDSMINIAKKASDIVYDTPEIKTFTERVRIGVARDDAFCFIYEDNIELLERIGAEVVYFSPMKDRRIPDGVKGIILPGGYPELHAEALSRNKEMLEDIRTRIDNGLPCMAECGGFMYLHEEMEDAHGNIVKMAGVIKGRSSNTKKLSRFGYISVRAKDSPILGNGEVRGHEFHYWDSTDPGNDCVATRPSNNVQYECMHCSGNLAAGYPHLYYYSCPKVPYNFLRLCREFGSVARKE
jgi:cobyrinic acid a,c-diamide synthase